jgi:hypothetical protein
VNNINQATRKSSLPSSWYLLKTETGGVHNCPVHGDMEAGPKKTNQKRYFIPGFMIILRNNFVQTSKVANAHGPLRTPSLLKSTNPSSTNVFERGPVQSSFRGRRSKTSYAPQKDVKKLAEDPKVSTMKFQRQWSLRGPSLTSSTADANISTSRQAQTVPSLSRPFVGTIPEYFRVASKDAENKHCQSMKKYPSQDDLHYNANATNLRKTSSSSASSIPSQVCIE